jgi:hypothetical protein
MPKTLVGKVKNNKFAYFWLLIGGSVGNILFILHNLNTWPIFLPPAILSLLIAVAVGDKLKRPKLLLAMDLIITVVLLALFVPYFGTTLREITILLPGALIVLGCILGICNW